jgi:hypothetical protein
MKRIFLLIALFCSCTVYAQNAEVKEKLVGGNSKEGQKVIRPLMEKAGKDIYGDDGKIIDSATAVAMLKTFKYKSHFGIPPGQTELKRMVSKIDSVAQEREDKNIIALSRAESPKLWPGAKLDLGPLSGRTDIAKLDGKAVVLIFWRANAHPRGTTSYEEINDVIAKYIDKKKFEVMAITGLAYNEAKKYNNINPILNAHFIIDAQAILNAYGVGDKPAIVVTDTNHLVKYAVVNYVAITPRILNNLLSEL